MSFRPGREASPAAGYARETALAGGDGRFDRWMLLQLILGEELGGSPAKGCSMSKRSLGLPIAGGPFQSEAEAQG